MDANQPKLVEDLRALGYSVAVTSSLGGGFPDIVVGVRGRNFLFEIKDPEKVPSKRKLTQDEADFHYGWKGQVCTITTVGGALQIMKEEFAR